MTPDPVWTIEVVAERFVDAARTARRLPRVVVQGYARTWPIVLKHWDEFPDPMRAYRLPPPSPPDVDRMWDVMRGVQMPEPVPLTPPTLPPKNQVVDIGVVWTFTEH